MPAATTTSAGRVDPKLVGKAVEALLKHHSERDDKKKSLLGNETTFEIQFGLSKVPEQPSPKPRRVPIPHALWKVSDEEEDDDGQEPSVCLLVKEDSKEWVQELISEFPKEMGLVKKVMGLESLRKKHAKFEQQRALLDRFDVFLADDRILPMLAKALGKHFFVSKKQPIPVRLSRKTSLPSMVLQSLQSTYWYLSEGTCLTVKVGHSGMSAKKLQDNVLAVCNHVPTKIPRQWSNVKSISVKTTRSVSLPVYNKTPEELQQIAKLAGIEETEVPSNVEKETKEKKQEEETARKQRKGKSPLIKALKKQEQDEDSKSSKKKKKRTADNEESASPPKKLKKMDEGSSKKSKKEEAAATPSKSSATPSQSSATKKEATPKRKDSEEPKSAKRGAKSAEKESNKKKPKKDEASEPKSSTKKAEEKSEFILTKKFQGSKKGYVFKKDKKGLGYYMDSPPVVDKMMIDALVRTTSNRRRSSSAGSKKQKGRSRR